jgi:hypothetical protein
LKKYFFGLLDNKKIRDPKKYKNVFYNCLIPIFGFFDFCKNTVSRNSSLNYENGLTEPRERNSVKIRFFTLKAAHSQTGFRGGKIVRKIFLGFREKVLNFKIILALTENDL